MATGVVNRVSWMDAFWRAGSNKARASVLPRRALPSNPPEMRQNIVPVDARDRLELKAMIEAETAQSGCRRGGFQRTDEMMW